MADIKELKAMAYDVLANIEFLQGKLREVNAKIAELAAEEQKQKENGSSDSNNGN